MADAPAGPVTRVDPPHPRYGRTRPLLRVHAARSTARLVIPRPDGRVQWRPRAVTDRASSAVAAPPPARMAVPTLLPRAPLVCARLTGQEERPHATAPALPVPRGASPGVLDPGELPGCPHAAAAGPRPLRPAPAEAACPGRDRAGAQP